MTRSVDRRSFLKSAAATGAAIGLVAGGSTALLAAEEGKVPLFKISLAEWSFNRALFAKKMDNLDFPVVAKRDFGIDCVEYVNQFFMDKARDTAYLTELKQRCDDNGVKSGLIMCDSEGDLGDPDDAKRTKAVENHYKWVEAAKFLGCHSITLGPHLAWPVALSLRRWSSLAATLPSPRLWARRTPPKALMPPRAKRPGNE